MSDQLDSLPNLNHLYAKLRIRQRRLVTIEKIFEDFKQNRPGLLEAVQEVRDRELELIKECENEISQTRAKIDEIAIVLGDELADWAGSVAGKILSTIKKNGALS